MKRHSWRKGARKGGRKGEKEGGGGREVSRWRGRDTISREGCSLSPKQSVFTLLTTTTPRQARGGGLIFLPVFSKTFFPSSRPREVKEPRDGGKGVLFSSTLRRSFLSSHLMSVRAKEEEEEEEEEERKGGGP